MLDQKDLDVVEETKRQVTENLKEKVLLGASKAFLIALTDTMISENPLNMVAGPFVAKGNKLAMSQIFDEVGISRDELKPDRLVEVANRAGLLSPAVYTKLKESMKSFSKDDKAKDEG